MITTLKELDFSATEDTIHHKKPIKVKRKVDKREMLAVETKAPFKILLPSTFENKKDDDGKEVIEERNHIEIEEKNGRRYQTRSKVKGPVRECVSHGGTLHGRKGDFILIDDSDDGGIFACASKDRSSKPPAELFEKKFERIS